MATAANDDDIEFPHKSEILAQRATHPCTCLKPSRISVCLTLGFPHYEVRRDFGVGSSHRHSPHRGIDQSSGSKGLRSPVSRQQQETAYRELARPVESEDTG